MKAPIVGCIILTLYLQETFGKATVLLFVNVHTCFSPHILPRLNAVSRHLTIDRSRGWREIESEWAVAEAAERRKQLQSSQKALKTRAQVGWCLVAVVVFTRAGVERQKADRNRKFQVITQFHATNVMKVITPGNQTLDQQLSNK